MKKLYVLLTFVTVLSISSIAQSEKSGNDLKPFKVDVSLGYAIPGGTGAKGGILFAFEPKYSIMSQLSVGLRFEGAVVARFSGYDEDGNPNEASVKAAGSYLVTGDYYFTDNYSFRPFAGIGAGIFSLASAEINSTSEGVSAGSKFGGMIRAGFELSHFRVGLEYNLVPKTEFIGFDNNGDEATLQSKNSYIGIKLGFCIGGGPR
jgi:outer membrane protein X